MTAKNTKSHTNDSMSVELDVVFAWNRNTDDNRYSARNDVPFMQFNITWYEDPQYNGR